MIDDTVNKIWMLKDFYSIDEMLDYVHETKFCQHSIDFLYERTVELYKQDESKTPNIYRILSDYYEKV